MRLQARLLRLDLYIKSLEAALAELRAMRRLTADGGEIPADMTGDSVWWIRLNRAGLLDGFMDEYNAAADRLERGEDGP
jgi:hypothetical protein